MSSYSRINARIKILNLKDLTLETKVLLDQKNTKKVKEHAEFLRGRIDDWEGERAAAHMLHYFDYNPNDLITELIDITESLIKGKAVPKGKEKYLSKEYEKLKALRPINPISYSL
jgi:hypothetical protein